MRDAAEIPARPRGAGVRLASAALLIGCTLTLHPAEAAPTQAAPTQAATTRAAEATAVAGLPVELTAVRKIAGIEEISGIQVLDAERLAFQVNRSANYLVTFTPACTLLPFAHSISMNYDRGTLHAGFDSVEADGQQCRINAIFQL